MSLIVRGNTLLGAYNNIIRQDYFMSTYYALVNDNVYVQYENPINLSFNQNFYLSGYYTNFGDTNDNIFSLPDTPVSHKYISEGTYFISYSAVYATSAVNEFQINAYQTDTPFIIKTAWEKYNPSDIRLDDEIIVKLPYTLEEIEIQPNEWGDEDIFNTSINRLQDCLEFLTAKTKTINTYSPTLFYGWLGNITGTKASILKWYTQSYNPTYINSPEISKSSGSIFFKNLIDAAEVTTPFGSVLYILDDKQFKVFRNGPTPDLVSFTNGDQLSSFLVDPVSFAATETGDVLYIADRISNNIYKILLSTDIFNPAGINVNLQLFVGGFGGLKDIDNFNTPTSVYYKNENVYVVDYNNFCIKQFNKDLNWVYTYFINEFEEDRPIHVFALKDGLVYILTEKSNVYIFDKSSNEIFETFPIVPPEDESLIKGMDVDENENFLLILTENKIHKYTLAGSYVSTFNLPTKDKVKFKNFKSGKNCSTLICSQNCILKTQDILQVFRLGEGLPYSYWDRNQLVVKKDEFVSDLVYNRSLLRISQNILTFKNTLNARFIIAAENVLSNVVTYFSYLPINILSEGPNIENDLRDIKIGVNELHIPSVFNREFKKIYKALEKIADFLSIKNYTVQNDDCLKSFCWSWDSTSCYNLKLPVIKTCSINPISYKEISVNQAGILQYAPNTTWEKAKSKCCEDRNPLG